MCVVGCAAYLSIGICGVFVLQRRPSSFCENLKRSVLVCSVRCSVRLLQTVLLCQLWLYLYASSTAVYSVLCAQMSVSIIAWLG